MAIEYAGGTIVRTTLDGTSKANFLSDLNAAMVSAGWSSTPVGADYHLTSAQSPDGLQMKARLTAAADPAYAAVSAYDMNDVLLGAQEMYIGVGIVYECLATRYTVWLWITGVASSLPVAAVTGWASAVAFGIPFLPDPVKPLVVFGATNTSPIQITTTADHEMLSGETVYITGVGGNTAANGTFNITVTGATTFTLDGSTGSGTYTSGGLVGNAVRLSRAIYINGNDGSGALDNNGWRRDPFQTVSGSALASYSSVMLNAYSVNSVGMNTPIVQPAAYPWRNTRSVIVEPYIYVLSATQAQVYGAVVIRGTPTPPRDTIFTMDGHNWVIYGVGGTNSALAIAVN